MGSFTNASTSGNVDGSNERLITTNPKVMVNGDVIFTCVGDVLIINLESECKSANDATATTIQYQSVPTTGGTVAISGVSSSLASLAAGASVTLDGSSLAAAPIVSTTGASLAQTARGIQVPDGTIKLVVAVGSTTGTWRHYLRYKPLEAGAYVQ